MCCYYSSQVRPVSNTALSASSLTPEVSTTFSKTSIMCSLHWCCVWLFCRYSAARKQFGPTPDKEIPVLEYQMQVSGTHPADHSREVNVSIQHGPHVPHHMASVLSSLSNGGCCHTWLPLMLWWTSVCGSMSSLFSLCWVLSQETVMWVLSHLPFSCFTFIPCIVLPTYCKNTTSCPLPIPPTHSPFWAVRSMPSLHPASPSPPGWQGMAFRSAGRHVEGMGSWLVRANAHCYRVYMAWTTGWDIMVYCYCNWSASSYAWYICTALCIMLSIASLVCAQHVCVQQLYEGRYPPPVVGWIVIISSADSHSHASDCG